MPDRSFTQDEVNKLVGDARVKARDKATTEYQAQADEDKKTAETAALAENQQWKELAEQHQARVTELEPLTEQVKAYEGMVAEMLKGKLVELGEEASKAVGGLPKGMTAIEKLRWLQTNEALFQATGDRVGTPRRLLKKEPSNDKPVEICKYPIKL